MWADGNIYPHSLLSQTRMTASPKMAHSGYEQHQNGSGENGDNPLRKKKKQNNHNTYKAKPNVMRPN